MTPYIFVFKKYRVVYKAKRRISIAKYLQQVPTPTELDVVFMQGDLSLEVNGAEWLKYFSEPAKVIDVAYSKDWLKRVTE